MYVLAVYWFVGDFSQSLLWPQKPGSSAGMAWNLHVTAAFLHTAAWKEKPLKSCQETSQIKNGLKFFQHLEKLDSGGLSLTLILNSSIVLCQNLLVAKKIRCSFSVSKCVCVTLCAPSHCFIEKSGVAFACFKELGRCNKFSSND